MKFIPPNTRVRIETLVGPTFEPDWSETGRTRKSRKTKGESVPAPDWSLVRFDSSGASLCIHNSRLMVCNEQPEVAPR
jgi:hypothetical protein